MKKVIALLLVLVLCLSLCACGGEPEVEMVKSFMLSDEKVQVEFKNVGKTTVSHVSGKINLFTGSATSQMPTATASFEWDGTCEKGETFTIKAEVNNSKSGLKREVNRIGHMIYEIS